ncbi:MAG: hypothetical protein EBZ11_04105 [Alphaproteobacteria bacterium]|nr:hypothetical protein [Alphaproteobacteria bacterium]
MTDYGTSFGAWRKASGAAWQDYVCHEFVTQLGDGSLPRPAFLHYLVQDYLFLIHFSRAWALAVTKADEVAEMRTCAATVNAPRPLGSSNASASLTRLRIIIARTFGLDACFAQ